MRVAPRRGLHLQCRWSFWNGGGELHRPELESACLNQLSRDWVLGLQGSPVHDLLSAAVTIAVIVSEVGGILPINTAQYYCCEF